MKTRPSSFTFCAISWENCSSRGRVLLCFKIMRAIQLSLWAAILLCNTLLSHTTMAGALDNWHLRNSGSNSFTDVIWVNDLFVAVRYRHPIMTSPDGVTWTVRPSGIASSARGIAYGNGRFVVVSAGGTNLTSTNGLDWIPGPGGTSFELLDVTFGNGQFVAVGGTILTSPDGLNWTARDSHGIGGSTVKFGNGKFFVHNRFSDTNLLSSDGVNWTPVRGPSIGPQPSFYCAGFGNGTWMLVDTGNNLWMSRDAVNWTSRGRIESERPTQIHYAYGTWIMVGGKTLSSRDGITWTERVSDPGHPLFCVTAGRHTFVAGGYQRIMQSDPVLNLEVSSGSPRELILSGPLGRTARIEFSESGAGDWQPVQTVTLDSDPYVWHIESRTARGFYRAVLLEQ